MHKTAEISACGQYRYLLTRWWGDQSLTNRMRQRSPLFVMLNPSTADATQDDHTIRKCRGFATRWGYEGFKVVNLYAYRATDPRDLRDAGYPVGPINQPVVTTEIFSALRLNVPIVCAWGGMAEPTAVERFRGWVAEARGEVDLHCLGVTGKSGMPRHPLMLAYATPLEPWA